MNTIKITTSAGNIICHVSENGADENLSYVAEIVYPDGYKVCEAIILNPDTQRLEFDIWNTPYRDDHGEIEEKLCTEIMNNNL
jgi:hypothetical protein